MKMPWEEDTDWGNTATTIVKGDVIKMLQGIFEEQRELTDEEMQAYKDMLRRKENDMELILKDKLKEVIEPMVGKFDDDGEFWWTRESILRAIDNAPTIEERKAGEWIRTGRTNVYGGEELMCPFCGDRVMVQNIKYELYCRQCGALLGDRYEAEE